MGVGLVLGTGAALLGAGAGTLGLVKGYNELKDDYIERAYRAGPNPITGKFDTGDPLGNLITPEQTDTFEAGYLPYMRRKDDDLRNMMTVLGADFDKGTKYSSVEDLKALNRDAYRRAKQTEDNEYTKGSLTYQQGEQNRIEQQRRYDQQRLDTLTSQRMQMEREDRRYNERLDREERNRRQESIMALMGGLTSLGAAFAM
jgi:hypothetical protein